MRRAQGIGWKQGVVAVCMAIGAMALMVHPGEAAITGTAHDFSGQVWSGGEICLVCHAPHNNASTVTDAPLWNHAVTAAQFQLYTSPTLDTTAAQQPGGVSKLCLSCHDGSVALDSYGGDAGFTTIGNTGANLGTDLSNDHPISITYNTAVASADGGLADPTSLGLPLFGANNDQVECASCHDVHDNANGMFLRASNNGSALCLTCHTK